MVVLHPSWTVLVAMVDSDTMVVAAEAADGNMVQDHKEVVEVADSYISGLPPANPVPVTMAMHGPTTGNSRIEFVSFVPGNDF